MCSEIDVLKITGNIQQKNHFKEEYLSFTHKKVSKMIVGSCAFHGLGLGLCAA